MKLLPPTDMEEYQQGNLEQAFRRIMLEYRDVPGSAGITRDMSPENVRHQSMMAEFYAAAGVARNSDLIEFQCRLWPDGDDDQQPKIRKGSHSYGVVQRMVQKLREIMKSEGTIK